MYHAHPATKFDVDAWQQKLMGPLLADCHSLWLIHNSKQHWNKKNQKRTRGLQQFERDLNDLFWYKSTVLASDFDLVTPPIVGLLTMPPGEIEKWIQSCKPIILFSCCEALNCRLTDCNYFWPTLLRCPSGTNPVSHLTHTANLWTAPSSIAQPCRPN
jgi:hypothetical protein